LSLRPDALLFNKRNAITASTTVTASTKSGTLNCGRKPHHGDLTPGRFSAGCPHCVIPLSGGAVTGQKYHCRLMGLWRDKPPQFVLRSDGYRFASYLAVFDRNRKLTQKKVILCDLRLISLPVCYLLPADGLGASSGVACPLGNRQLTYLRIGYSIFKVQRRT